MRPLLVERFLAICIPASVLLAAAGFDYLLDHLRWLGAVALLLLVLYSARSIRFFYLHPDINDDWRGATAYVLAHAQPGDELVVLPAYARFTFDYYRKTVGPHALPLRIVSSDSDLVPPLPETVWFIGSNFPRKGATEAEVSAFLTSHDEYCETGALHFTAVMVRKIQRCGNR